MIKLLIFILFVLVVPFFVTLGLTVDVITAVTMVAAVFASAYLVTVILGFDKVIESMGDKYWYKTDEDDRHGPAFGYAAVWGAILIGTVFAAAVASNPGLLVAWLYGTVIGAGFTSQCPEAAKNVAKRVVYTLRGVSV